MISGTAIEPRPMLTAHAMRALRVLAESPKVSDGPGGRGSAALLTTADGHTQPALELTARRAISCAVEHGTQREALIAGNLQRVADNVSATTATRPGLDLLAGLDTAVRGVSPSVLTVVSNGLSSTGGFDIREVGWNADPSQVAAQLHARGLLPDLTGWRVLWSGLGATAGPQPALPRPLRLKLQSYWTAICHAAGAVSCEFDDTPLDPIAPISTAAMPVIPIPEISSVRGPRGETVTTLPDALLGFGPDSAVIAPAAADIIASVAGEVSTRLTTQTDTMVTVTGYTADPPGSTPTDRQQLSLARAQAVADALSAAFPASAVHPSVVVVGGGAAPNTTSVHNGAFIEAIAVGMRRVEISY